MKPQILLHFLVCIMLCSCATNTRAFLQRVPQSESIQFFYTPEDAHRTWINAIQEAKQTIFMEMFHLTDPAIIDALRAKAANVEITLILDSGNLKDPSTAQLEAQLLADRPNIHAYPSSALPNGFSQTHTKAMVADGVTALITSINLTTNAAVQRDYGIVTSDASIIAEMISVFNADVQNSMHAQQGLQEVKYTPTGVGQGNLIWSPVSSEARLVSLIQESQSITSGDNKTLFATVENLGDPAIEAAFSTAAASGVQVRIIVPQCVLGVNGPRNFGFFSTLKNGVQIRVMPHPSSAQAPYMHGKMMVLGNGRAYIGSVNFSTNSTKSNRELGIIFSNSQIAAQLKGLFLQDWNQALDVPDPSSRPACPTNTNDPSK